jgi:hypothetical protein
MTAQRDVRLADPVQDLGALDPEVQDRRPSMSPWVDSGLSLLAEITAAEKVQTPIRARPVRRGGAHTGQGAAVRSR